MVKEMNALDVLNEYRQRFDTLGDCASSLAISKQYLSDMLKGRRDLSPRMLGKLGLRKTVVQGK